MSGKKEKVIEVKNLVMRYHKAKESAVDKISFYVNRGEFYAFLGPNGAGKTTTISILTTLLSKTSGVAKVAGFDVEHEAKQVRSQIGVIFQKPSLDENLTAEENVRFHAILYGLYPFAPTYGMMPKSYKKKLKNLTKVLGIEKEINNQVKGFSGGMKRKLEIVRSLMHDPKILFLDEPTSGLDPESRKNLWQYLNQVRRDQDTTIFLTTHYLEEAEEADHLSIINNGKIVSFGSPDQIKKDLIDRYILIDSKQKNKLEEELKKLKLNYERGDKFKINLNGKNAAAIIQSIKTPLTDLKVHTPTLEEAYIKIIEK